MTLQLAVSHPDDLTIGSITPGWLMGIVGCHPDDLRYSPISSGWHNIIWTLSHPDEITMLMPKSSGWVSPWPYLIRMTFGHCSMSSGWLSRNRYLLRMSYDNVIMSSGWHKLPFLSHPDEIVNFDFPHHAVALQRFRSIPIGPSDAMWHHGFWPSLLQVMAWYLHYLNQYWASIH